MPGIHDGHRVRVKKEFRENGLDHFPPHKILETLLFYAIRQGDTNELGHRLLERFGSLSGVLDADYLMLSEVPGIGEESATLIKLVAGVVRAYMEDYVSVHDVINDFGSAKEYMRCKFLCQPRECVLLVCMGNNGKVVFCNKIAEGSPEQVSLSPASVVRTAMRANAVGAVLAHNHPNGICLPSHRDRSTTEILRDALRQVEVQLLDHIIVAPDGVYSMAENGMLPGGGFPGP